MTAGAIFAGAVLVAALAVAALPEAQPAIRVVDGDTISIGRERIRVMGVDTPELHGYRCADELYLAQEAKRFTAAFLAAGRAHVDRRGVDRYGRTLARVSVEGRDLADALIAAKLGRLYHGGQRQPWCAPR